MSERRPRRPRVLDQRGGNVVLDLFVLHQHLGSLLAAALEPTGVTPAQYAVYGQLGQRDQTPSELGRTLGLPLPTLSGHLAAMDRRGDIARTRSDRDGRSHVVALTEAGRARLEECRPRMRQAVAALNAELGGRGAAEGVRDVLAGLDDAIRAVTP
ncbi:MarR family transcriptional regulator [Actinopolymorpha rutila]|uniref:DNA-binding MarR family transcriptional regulator n=1 Tax=Actinopolymorpha rutila TaxID=446787 RepID=A0A852ZDM5_9ACTN|nr:DNA-binding MarR family transcriptional regulator [Actinopolymorpha rutila]